MFICLTAYTQEVQIIEQLLFLLLLEKTGTQKSFPRLFLRLNQMTSRSNRMNSRMNRPLLLIRKFQILMKILHVKVSDQTKPFKQCDILVFQQISFFLNNFGRFNSLRGTTHSGLLCSFSV